MWRALASLVVNARTLNETQRANRDAHEREREAQVTDRYTKAIGQLGDAQLAIRLGGIYALERIAVDSPRDHRTVVEVLSAYVRDATQQVRDATEQAKPKLPSDRPVAQEGPGKLVDVSVGAVRPPPQAATDIAVAVTVQGRLPNRKGVLRADLTNAFLPGLELVGADLTRAQLAQANLSSAKLIDVGLSGAWLMNATLSGARLDSVDLSHATLYRADLSLARLDSGTLRNATLREANLSHITIFDTDVFNADLGQQTSPAQNWSA